MPELVARECLLNLNKDAYGAFARAHMAPALTPV
jgi:hypothetical protein